MAIPNRLNSAGEILAEMQEFGFNDGSDNKLGELAEDGLTLDAEAQETEVNSGSQRDVYARLVGRSSQSLSGTLLNLSIPNFAFVFGLDEDAGNITGTGTAGDPYILTVDAEKFGEQPARLYYAQGLRKNGDVIRLEATARVRAPAVNTSLAQGQVGGLPFSLVIEGTWAIKQWTP